MSLEYYELIQETRTTIINLFRVMKLEKYIEQYYNSEDKTHTQETIYKLWLPKPYMDSGNRYEFFINEKQYNEIRERILCLS